MSGSTDPDLLSRIAASLFGGGSTPASAASMVGGVNDPNLGPTGWSNSGEATWNPTTSTGSGVSSSDVSKALSSLAKGVGSSSGTSSGSTSNPQLSSSSSFSAGKGSGLDAIVQALAKRREMYQQAATGGGSGKSGLLGV